MNDRNPRSRTADAHVPAPSRVDAVRQPHGSPRLHQIRKEHLPYRIGVRLDHDAQSPKKGGIH